MVYPQGRTPFRPTRIKGAPMDAHYTATLLVFFRQFKGEGGKMCVETGVHTINNS